jgi:hypothetical protein
LRVDSVIIRLRFSLLFCHHSRHLLTVGKRSSAPPAPNTTNLRCTEQAAQLEDPSMQALSYSHKDTSWVRTIPTAASELSLRSNTRRVRENVLLLNDVLCRPSMPCMPHAATYSLHRTVRFRKFSLIRVRVASREH